MNSPCVNCGADSRVCKECDWYNGVWISKDQYEAKLKADIKDILDKIRADIIEKAKGTMNDTRAEGLYMALQIIEKYKKGE